MPQKELIKVQQVNKSYKNSEGQARLVLETLNLTLYEGEFVALVGKSGSGKSTLLRIISGLIKPTEGDVYFNSTPVHDPVPGITMVFQNFALLPWLTVLENVELGLEAQGIPRKIRRQRALKAIDTIGLDGFESAYPKELSGGMKQRVGFARALVVEPKLLLMDEPFSALDILTAENLRNDLLDLWHSDNTQIKGILCVTHDIEEAILMADKIIIFASNPGRIHAEIPITLPYPRDIQSPEYRELLTTVYNYLISSEGNVKHKTKHKSPFMTRDNKIPAYATRLPDVGVSELTGLLETMHSQSKDDKVDLAALAEALHLDVNNLFPLTDALVMLQFVTIDSGHLLFTEAGKLFVAADILQRKQIFAKHLLTYIPLGRHIREILDAKFKHRAPKEYFINELIDLLGEEETDKALKVIIDWGRYAEVFAFDFDADTLSLENPQ